MHLIVFARAVRAASSQAILSTCGSRYSTRSSQAAFHGNTLRSLVYYIHMDSYTRRIPFPYSFGSRVGYYSIHCYLAPVSVSPFRGYSANCYHSLDYSSKAAQFNNSLVVSLFASVSSQNYSFCSFWLVVSVAPILLQIDPTFKPTFQCLAFSQFNTIRTIHALFVLKLLHNISTFLSQSGLGAVFEFRA